MKAVRKSKPEIATKIIGGNIPISNRLAEVFQQIEKRDLSAFIQNLRLDLHSRFLSLSGDDVIKLQGKLEYIDELEKFLEKIISGKS